MALQLRPSKHRRLSLAQRRVLELDIEREAAEHPVIEIGSPAPAQPPLIRKLGPDVLQDIATYLPARQQFGTLRTVSRTLHRTLPSLPQPEPLFTVNLKAFTLGPTTVHLGVHRISHIPTLLRDIQSGTLPIPTTGDVHTTRLEFYYTQLDLAPHFRERMWTGRTMATFPHYDLDVGLRSAGTGPTRFNIPQAFGDMNVSTVPPKHNLGAVSGDQIVAALWDVYDQYVRQERTIADIRLQIHEDPEAVVARLQRAHAATAAAAGAPSVV